MLCLIFSLLSFLHAERHNVGDIIYRPPKSTAKWLLNDDERLYILWVTLQRTVMSLYRTSFLLCRHIVFLMWQQYTDSAMLQAEVWCDRVTSMLAMFPSPPQGMNPLFCHTDPRVMQSGLISPCSLAHGLRFPLQAWAFPAPGRPHSLRSPNAPGYGMWK